MQKIVHDWCQKSAQIYNYSTSAHDTIDLRNINEKNDDDDSNLIGHGQKKFLNLSKISSNERTNRLI